MDHEDNAFDPMKCIEVRYDSDRNKKNRLFTNLVIELSAIYNPFDLLFNTDTMRKLIHC